MKKKFIIAVDFDGTCVRHEFPNIGAEVPYCVDVLKELVKAGHNLILFTMRSDIEKPSSDIPDIHTKGGLYLSEAVNWFSERGIVLYGINSNPTQKKWTHSPKVYANIYIDDLALGCPLFYVSVGNPYVDWVAVRKLLVLNEFL